MVVMLNKQSFQQIVDKYCEPQFIQGVYSKSAEHFAGKSASAQLPPASLPQDDRVSLAAQDAIPSLDRPIGAVSKAVKGSPIEYFAENPAPSPGVLPKEEKSSADAQDQTPPLGNSRGVSPAVTGRSPVECPVKQASTLPGHEPKPGFFTSVFEAVSDALYWPAASTAQYIRRCFYQTEYELLIATTMSNQQVRVTRHMFGERNYLYGHSINNPIYNRFLNPTKIYQEWGISRGAKMTALELCKTAPYVLQEHIKKLHDQITQSIDPLLLMTHETVGSSSCTDRETMIRLEKSLLIALENASNQVADLIQPSTNGTNYTLRRVKDKLVSDLDQHFPDVTDVESRDRYKVSPLKMNLRDSFDFANKYAETVIQNNKSMVRHLKNPLEMNCSIEEHRARLHSIYEEVTAFKTAQEDILADMEQNIRQHENIIYGRSLCVKA